MALEILNIMNSMIGETLLPHVAVFQAERKSSFDELDGAFEGDFFCRSEQQMEVVGHDHEFVKEVFSFIAIVRESVDQEIGGCDVAENGLAVRRDGCDEEDAIEVHGAMVCVNGCGCL